MDTSSEIAVARELGIEELRFFSRINYGGGAACATVQQAAMAVATGVADVVVAYRGFNERSESRFGQVALAAATQVNTNGLDNAWTYPMGLGTPAATVAMQARRYMHEYGATSADFGRVAVADRRHAATNPNAFFYGKPITLEDHQASRMIVDPLHLLDCCQESDGAVALVITSAERARDLAQTPAVDRGGGAGERRGPVRDDVVLPRRHRHPRDGRRRPRAVAPVRARTRRHADGDPLRPLHAVRAHAARGAGLLRPRRGAGFIADGAIELGGRLPLNTHGGQLGEAYIHGMNGIAEAVRQIRGTSVNPVDDARTCWSRPARASRPAGSSSPSDRIGGFREGCRASCSTTGAR